MLKKFTRKIKQWQTVKQVKLDRSIKTGGDPRRLEQYGYKVYSQSDEDGIIDEIFRRIGTTNRTFVEFGVEIGLECNTRYLLENGWNGLWIEANPDYVPAIHHHCKSYIQTGKLKVIEARVTIDNINNLIADSGIRGEIDFLSIDIDGNDYHVYDAISVIEPRVVCLEHNCNYPPPSEWIMPYDPCYQWSGNDPCYGASIICMEKLAKKKGMTLVGCGLYSPNGFYVKTCLVNDDLFCPPYCPERLFNQSNYDKIVSFPVGKFMRNI